MFLSLLSRYFHQNLSGLGVFLQSPWGSRDKNEDSEPCSRINRWTIRVNSLFFQRELRSFRQDLQRVLADLAREDQRAGQLYGKDRKFERKSIALQVEVVSISQGKGILEIPYARLDPQPLPERRLDRFPSPLKCSEIGVHLLDGDQGPIWMHGQVVRERPIQEGFWELGVKFIGPLAQPA